jgi:hypothetical protein
MPKSFSARIFVALIVISGLLVLGYGMLHVKSLPALRSVAFLMVACLAARLKIKLPRLTGTMSVNLPFLLLAAVEMNTAEALAVGFISTVVQCLPRGQQKINMVQAAFSCSTITLAVAAARLMYCGGWLFPGQHSLSCNRNWADRSRKRPQDVDRDVATLVPLSGGKRRRGRTVSHHYPRGRMAGSFSGVTGHGRSVPVLQALLCGNDCPGCRNGSANPQPYDCRSTCVRGVFQFRM